MALNLQVVGNLFKQMIMICGILLPTGLLAQFQFSSSQIPVFGQDLELRMPWAGGLNSIQYNNLDLNFDGNSDLVLFDRSANKLSTFLWESNGYVYAPEYEIFFPEDLVSWVLLRDYDCDGFNDLFSDSQQGMRVFKNSGMDPLSWQLIEDPVPTLGSQIINLFFNASDIASIDDLDGDGDLDVLAYNFATGETIDYHKNMSVENSGACGLDFVRITREYGGISECNCGEFNFIEPCPVNGRLLHSGGKTILSIDLDNDGDKEILSGEETCNELTLLTNTGDLTNAVFEGFSNFFEIDASATNINFPGAYNIDLNADGLKDLAVSTNLRENNNSDVDFTNSSYFYQNNGSTGTPKFELIETNFLQKDMIDVGEYAYPAFADYDKDGDQDLFIGNRGNGNTSSTLYLYENTGSAINPAFEFITNDYLQLSALTLTDLKPQFLDLNSDGRSDLIITGSRSSREPSEMIYLLNKSTVEFEFNVLEVEVLSDIPALADHPTLADVNSDGLIDLLVGRATGTLEFYENFNSNLNPNFQLSDANFLDINVSIDRINLVPFLFDLNRDGIQDLITTDGSGELSIYENFSDGQPSPKRDILINPLTEEFQHTNFGRISFPVITDLYNTGSIDLAVGTISGGIFLLSDTTSLMNLPNTTNLEVFPNPTLGRNALVRSGADGTFQIFNISGKLMISKISLTANQPFLLDPTLYPNGVYIIRFITNTGEKISRRLIVSN